MRRVIFRVAGVAESQGSTRSQPYVRPDGTAGSRTRSANPKLNDWRQRVGNTALAVRRGIFFDRETAVDVRLIFYLPRPQSTPKRIEYPIRKPDIDKLERAILDALTNVLWVDDAQVTDVTKRKRFAPGGTCYVAISVSEMPSGGRNPA